jgi:hypothetical protein
VHEDGSSADVGTLAVLGACDGVINRLLDMANNPGHSLIAPQ